MYIKNDEINKADALSHCVLQLYSPDSCQLSPVCLEEENPILANTVFGKGSYQHNVYIVDKDMAGSCPVCRLVESLTCIVVGRTYYLYWSLTSRHIY